MGGRGPVSNRVAIPEIGVTAFPAGMTEPHTHA